MKTKNVLIIRSAPFDVFNKAISKFKDAEITAIIQEDIKDQFEISKSICKRILTIPPGPFKWNDSMKTRVNEIKDSNYDYLIIPSNNSLFKGYSEVMKLALHLKIQNVLMIDVKLNEKKIGAFGIWGYILRETNRKQLEFDIIVYLLNLAGRTLKHFNIEFILIDLPERVGHLVATPDWYLKEKIVNNRKIKSILVINDKKVVNPFVLRCWKTYFFKTINSAWLDQIIRRNEKSFATYFKIQKLDIANYAKTVVEYAGKPLIKLSNCDKRKGRDILKAMGIPEDTWFVCLHNREDGYLPDLQYHSYRDGNIENHLTAMRFIAEQGGFVIRMGDPTMRPLPKMTNVIDYAHHEMRSDFMDVFLCSECLFFLGNTSGLFICSEIFGKTIGCVNWIPLEYKPLYFQSCYIPKLIFSKKQKRYLTFKEILNSDICTFVRTEDYEKAGLEVHENTEDDIKDLIEEMYLKVTGKLDNDIQEKELVGKFSELYSERHRGFYSKARIGRKFIKKYSHLL